MRFGMVMVLLMAMTGTAYAEQGRITMNGTGTVYAEPDMAVVTVGATHQAKSAKAAMDQVSGTVEKILVTLSASGVEPRDMQTSGIRLDPVRDHRSYDDGGPRLVGFSASNQVSVRVRDLDNLGEILGDLVAVGANDVNGVRFDVREPRNMQDEARKLAVVDARAKAELYAEAAGVRLGRIVSISESGGSRPRPEMMRAASMADSAAVPVAAGELALEAQVQIVWELAE
ncbi:SIMPL domain-containing protein [Shimia abyssi]|uniref:SIMPL domain-containing protein n=1 Tax=Shimia abyssi TaxID=1662395 RepID=A0A2P8F5Z2_9RHOB|nr:SIMPL domain-containing protein [Shimia abyssi]PSL17127.1 hypothetical protein CLV88_12137 [Shimia abyssi]